MTNQEKKEKKMHEKQHNYEDNLSKISDSWAFPSSQQPNIT